jgi:hypothetical protein
VLSWNVLQDARGGLAFLLHCCIVIFRSLVPKNIFKRNEDNRGARMERGDKKHNNIMRDKIQK